MASRLQRGCPPQGHHDLCQVERSRWSTREQVRQPAVQSLIHPLTCYTHRRTETKAITTWAVSELSQVVPKLMRPLLRSSKNYVKGKDCISFQAQTKRDRNANAEENRAKLLEELHRMYSDAVPGDTSVEKVQKHKAL